jgi:hypothetical protein
MDFPSLSFYPNLDNILNVHLSELILKNSQFMKGARQKTLMNIYACFIDITHCDVDIYYSGLDILNDSQILEKNLELLVGFIYVENENSLASKYNYATRFKTIFTTIAKEKGLNPPIINLSQNKLSVDVQLCIDLYQKHSKNLNKIAYYDGWKAYDKESRHHNLHLARVQSCYGYDFTQKIHQALIYFIKKQKHGTAQSVVQCLTALLNDFTELKPNLTALNVALKPQNITGLFLDILNFQIAQCIQKKNNLKTLINNKWVITVQHFEGCFIRSGLFDEPIQDFIKPKYKVPKTNLSASTGGGLDSASKERLLTNIPLSISDEKSIEMIFENINKDIEHVRFVSQKIIDDTIKNQKRNQQLLKKGTIKIPGLNGNNILPMGPNHFENTLATFKHYTFNYNKRSYNRFLGFDAKAQLLTKELNLPTVETILPFLTQLVLEHPQLTPSWFLKWQLFDKLGQQSGFKQSGDQFVITSVKDRKGSSKAQQDIILTEKSKHTVEALIAFTQLVREELKKQGNEDWRYMLITTNGLNSQPKSMKWIKTNDSSHKKFQNVFICASTNTKGESILSRDESKHLAPLISLRATRSSRAIQIYLETNSVRAMSEALGHSNYNPNLLSSYLPDVLLEYFNSRWVRIFQNSIVYEAMKDSPYLIEAIDFTVDELDEFLLNHKLGELPEHIKKGKAPAQSNTFNPESIGSIDELVIILSVPLLQMLIAITDIVENANDECLPEIFEKWYECAAFTINHLSLCQSGQAHSLDFKEVIPLFEKAKSNPFDTQKIKDNLCR